MSQSLDEDDAVLKDLVSKTLLSNGALGKLQAELRAGVFLALEEEFKDRNVPLCNRRTQELLASPAGSLAASLVHDFLTCLGLDFTLSVYGPESNLGAGLWNLLNRQELLQHLSLDQDKEPSIPVLLWQCREEQLTARDCIGASLLRLDTKDNRGRGSAVTNEDKAAQVKNNKWNNSKVNNYNDDNHTSQKMDIIGNTKKSQSSHSVDDNNLSSSQRQSDFQEKTSASSSLPVVSKAILLGTVGSELNNSAAPAKGSKAAGAASTPAVTTSVATSKTSVVVSKTVASSTANRTETLVVTSETSATKFIGTIISDESSDTNTTLTSSNSGGLISSSSRSNNYSASPECLQSSKYSLSTKTSKLNVKGTTSTVASGKLTSQANDQTIASSSISVLAEGESSSRGASSSHLRLREAAVVHPPENILSAAPPDTRADSADSSSSASEGDLQRLASNVFKGAAGPLGRPQQPLPFGGTKPANRVLKTGVDQAADEPDYGEDEDFSSSSSTWSDETKSADDGAASSHGANKEAEQASGDGGGKQEKTDANLGDKHAQDKLNAKLRLHSPEDSDPLETGEDISIGDFSTSESVSGREETEDLSAPPSRSAVVDYEEAL